MFKKKKKTSFQTFSITWFRRNTYLNRNKKKSPVVSSNRVLTNRFQFISQKEETVVWHEKLVRTENITFRLYKYSDVFREKKKLILKTSITRKFISDTISYSNLTIILNPLPTSFYFSAKTDSCIFENVYLLFFQTMRVFSCMSKRTKFSASGFVSPSNILKFNEKISI